MGVHSKPCGFTTSPPANLRREATRSVTEETDGWHRSVGASTGLPSGSCSRDRSGDRVGMVGMVGMRQWVDTVFGMFNGFLDEELHVFFPSMICSCITSLSQLPN